MFILSVTAAIGDEISNSEWVEVDDRLKKDLMFILMRSQKPSFITAWKFSQVSLHSYGLILSTAASYFTFLRHVFDESTA